jgi:hypothetical protein
MRFFGIGGTVMIFVGAGEACTHKNHYKSATPIFLTSASDEGKFLILGNLGALVLSYGAISGVWQSRFGLRLMFGGSSVLHNLAVALHHRHRNIGMLLEIDHITAMRLSCLSTGQKTKIFLKPLIFGRRSEALPPKNQGFQGFCPVLGMR